jgi:hypothetical protein
VVTFPVSFVLGQNHLLSLIEGDKIYLNRLFLSDEATFHVCGTVSNNCHMWASENPHYVTEYEHDSCEMHFDGKRSYWSFLF